MKLHQNVSKLQVQIPQTIPETTRFMKTKRERILCSLLNNEEETKKPTTALVTTHTIQKTQQGHS